MSKQTPKQDELRSEAARMLGRLGGLARVKNQTPGERSRSAAVAARARWEKIRVGGRELPANGKFIEDGFHAGAPVRPTKEILGFDPGPAEQGPFLRVAAVTETTLTFNTEGVPRNAKERLAAGLCRSCPTPRHVDPGTGKKSALWCKTHLDKQREQDKKSWHDRHGS